MSINSPVLLILYKRPEKTMEVFKRIAEAKPKKLYVSANAPRMGSKEEEQRCNETRKIIDLVDWECKVHKFYRDEYLPVELSETTAISWFFDNEDEGIILEDDCVPDITFFRFCDELLEKYRYDTRIATITGSNTRTDIYNREYSYFYSRLGSSWGWASWKRVWKEYDLKMKLWPLVKSKNYLYDIFDDKKVAKFWEKALDRNFIKPNTWDYQFAFLCLINNYLNILPSQNLISNIGYGEDAEHTKEMSKQMNMRVTSLNFPLSHPPFIIRNKKSDREKEKKWAKRSTIKSRFLKRFENMFYVHK